MRALILLVPLALFLTACKKESRVTSAASAPPAVSVPVLAVRAEPFSATVPVTGTLVSNAQVDVKAETTGRVVRFDKEAGDRVAAGEAVIWVNDENFQLSLRQTGTGVKVAEAALERARLLESHSRAELERAENLLKSGGITDKDLKAAQLADRDAKAGVQVAAAQLDQNRAALDLAQKHLRDAVVKSPVNGEIQKKFANKGAYVEPATPVFTVVDNGRLELESLVASADLAPIRSGQRVVFSVNSYPGIKFEGSVIEIAPAMDTETRSARVRIRVPNPGGKLKAGMFAEGEIQTGVTAAAIVVPAAAVYRDDRSAKSSHVFVVENGKAATRNVRIGRERDGTLEIVEGLKTGDQLISEQNIEIAEGVTVQPKS